MKTDRATVERACEHLHNGWYIEQDEKDLHDLLLALLAEKERAWEMIRHDDAELVMLVEQISDLRTKLAAAEIDAKRYRYVRSQPNVNIGSAWILPVEAPVSNTPDELDAAIDAALSLPKPADVGKAGLSDLPREAVRLGELIRTQDNRITALPMFAVQQKIRITGLDPEYADSVVWLHCDGDYEEADDEEHAKFEDAYNEGEEVKGWMRSGYRDTWEFVTCCLTEQGCKNYIRVNGHNLKEHRIYAYSGFRNAEWEFLRDYFLAIAAVTAPTAGKESESIPLHQKALAAVADSVWEREFLKLREDLRVNRHVSIQLRVDWLHALEKLCTAVLATPPITPQDKAAPSTLDAGTASQPMPREWWVRLLKGCDDGFAHLTFTEAWTQSKGGTEIIHVREVSTQNAERTTTPSRLTPIVETDDPPDALELDEARRKGPG